MCVVTKGSASALTVRWKGWLPAEVKLIKEIGRIINRHPTCELDEVVLKDAESRLAVNGGTLSLASHAKAECDPQKAYNVRESCLVGT